MTRLSLLVVMVVGMGSRSFTRFVSSDYRQPRNPDMLVEERAGEFGVYQVRYLPPDTIPDTGEWVRASVWFFPPEGLETAAGIVDDWRDRFVVAYAQSFRGLDRSGFWGEFVRPSYKKFDAAIASIIENFDDILRRRYEESLSYNKGDGKREEEEE